MPNGYRLLMLAGAAVVAISLAAGPAGSGTTQAAEPAPVCDKTKADGGTRPPPKGLLMVAELATPSACEQGS